MSERCAVCGSEFERTVYNRRVCSEPCRLERQRQHNRRHEANRKLNRQAESAVRDALHAQTYEVPEGGASVRSVEGCYLLLAAVLRVGLEEDGQSRSEFATRLPRPRDAEGRVA